MTRLEAELDRPDVRSDILAAAAGLLENGGASAVTTRAVADAAGVQPPTLYRQFGDKEGLLDALAEYVLEQHMARKLVREESRDHGADPIDELRDGWLAQVEFGVAHAELFLLLVAPGRAARSSAAQAGYEVFRSKVSRLAVAGRLRVGVERAMDILHASSVGATLALIERSEGERDDELALAMFDAAIGVVLDRGQEPRGQESLVVAFATMVPDLPGLTEGERALLKEWTTRALAALDGMQVRR